MYTAEDYINFIETKRFDKISNYGLELIAKKFREYEKQDKELTDGLNDYLEFRKKRKSENK
jgi:hypothetical protein